MRKCLLLELPTELRLRIYDFVFEEMDYTVTLDNSHSREITFGISPTDRTCPALLQTCKTVHSELVPALYIDFILHLRFKHTDSPFQDVSPVDEKLAPFKSILKSIQHVCLVLKIGSDDSWVMKDVQSMVEALEEAQNLKSCSIQLSVEPIYSTSTVVSFLIWSCNEVLFRIPEESTMTTNTVKEIVFSAIKTEAEDGGENRFWRITEP